MKKYIWLMACLVAFSPLSANAAKKQKKAKKAQTELWPDGTKMDAWFSNAQKVNVDTLGKKYVLTDYGVKTDSTLIQTKAIQAVIDRAAQGWRRRHRRSCRNLSERCPLLPAKDPSLSFRRRKTERQRPHRQLPCSRNPHRGRDLQILLGLHQCRQMRRLHHRRSGNHRRQRLSLLGGVLDSSHLEPPVHQQGCTAPSPRLYQQLQQRNLAGCAYSRTVRSGPTTSIAATTSASWAATIFAPTSGMRAPSSDAIDIDVCHDVLVDGCYMSVNDDAIAIKGGKGTWADQAPENGPVYNVLIQNCNYGSVHGCLTLGSESVKDRNIVLRNIKVGNAQRVLWLKMRPDTPQHYEYVTVDNIQGTTGSFLVIRPWTQFFKPGDRKDMPSEPVQQHHDEEHPDGLRQLLRCGQEREIPSGRFHLREHHLHRQEDGIRCQPHREHRSKESEYHP